MIKRNFIVLLLLFFPYNESYGKDKIIATTSSPPEYLKNNLYNFKNNIEQKFSPKTEVVLLINGESGSEENSLNGLRRGRSNISFVSVGALSSIIPELSILSLPFLFNSNEEADFVLDNYLLDYFKKEMISKNLNLLRWVDSGWSIIYLNTFIKGPSNLRNLRIRTPSSISSRIYFKEFNADIVQLPFSEVIPALQTGLIDGGTTSILMFHIAGIYEYAPYLKYTNHALNPGAVVTNYSWFNKISTNNKQIIDESFPSSHELRLKHRNFECETENKIKKLGITLEVIDRKLWNQNIKTIHNKILDEVSGNSGKIYNIILEAKKNFFTKNIKSKDKCN